MKKSLVVRFLFVFLSMDCGNEICAHFCGVGWKSVSVSIHDLELKEANEIKRS